MPMTADTRTLLVDLGGTNVRFALREPGTGQALRTDSIASHLVVEFESLVAAARHYLDVCGRPSVQHAVLAVAGPVDGDQARITNHPWLVSASRMRSELGLQQVRLINDFAAQAMAIALYRPEDLRTIGAAEWRASGHRDATYAVIGPGTGLGVGGLLVRDGRYLPLQTEGGHVGFAPGNAEEIAILDYLSEQYGRVSIERLISGPGLVNIHRALSAIAGRDPGELQPADVTARAGDGDAHCRHAVDVFCNIFGAVAGDLVLTLGAWDGVFLAGGLSSRLIETLQHSGFRERFEHKGRFSGHLARTPSVAVIHPHAGLLGAAAYAQYLMRDVGGS